MLTCAADGFGDEGAEGIPPGSTLEVDLELLSWKKVGVTMLPMPHILCGGTSHVSHVEIAPALGVKRLAKGDLTLVSNGTWHR